MGRLISRRQVLKGFSSAGASALLGARAVSAQDAAIRVAGRPVEIAIAPGSAHTVRISVVPIEEGRLQPIAYDGSLVQQTWAPPNARLRTLARPESVRCGDLVVKLSPEPLVIRVETGDGRPVQQLRLDSSTGSLTFHLGDG